MIGHVIRLISDHIASLYPDLAVSSYSDINRHTFVGIMKANLSIPALDKATKDVKLTNKLAMLADVTTKGLQFRATPKGSRT